MTQEQISKESSPFESVEEFENFAKKSLTSAAYQYFAGFADLGITFKENAEAFKRYGDLQPEYRQF